MQLLRSFEDSHKGTYGDLLSRQREKKRITVGLILFGYFEYWRMFSDEFRTMVEKDLKTVEEKLRSQYNVVSTDLVDTLDSADICGRILRDNQVDAIVLVMGTYVPDYITMHTLNYVRDVPMLIFSVQHAESIAENDGYVNRARDLCLSGTAQLSATLHKIRRKHKTVVGSVNDARAYEVIGNFLDSIQAIQDVKEANVGILGNVFRGMYDIELSKTFLKGVFDVNVIYIQEAHLVESWEETTQAETRELADRLQKRFRTRIVTEQDILQACRLAIALRKLVQKYRLDGLCLLDQHFLQRMFRTTSRVGASLLLEKYNFPVSCEGDLGSLVLGMLMQSLARKNPMQGGWCGYDEKLNACLIGGHGVADPAMAGSDDQVTLTRTPEEWGMEGMGLNYEFGVKPGVCTISSLLEKPSGYSILISRGEIIPHATLSNNEIYAFARLEMPVKQFFERIFQFGVTQHCMLCLDDIQEKLAMVADHLNLETLAI